MTSRRQFVAAMLSGLTFQSLKANPAAFQWGIDPALFKIAFGSCVSQRGDQAFWRSILGHQPDVFVMMGDGVYPEHESEGLTVLESIEAAYRQARTRTEMSEFRNQVPTIAIWDDNDFGGSDIGACFQHKERSKELFLDFWAGKGEKSTRDRESGIYGLWEFGSEDRRTQIIIPDLRYCRSEWTQSSTQNREILSAYGFGPYVSNDDPGLTMLGELQWNWLEECLSRPAKVRILVSSIQCIPEGRGWESWSLFPAERARLFNLIRDTGAEGLVILSGDSHYAEVSRLEDSAVGFPLWEITSSGLTEEWKVPGPNPHRVGLAYPETNYGLMLINWVDTNPVLVFEIYATTGKRLRQQTVMLESLKGAA